MLNRRDIVQNLITTYGTDATALEQAAPSGRNWLAALSTKLPGCNLLEIRRVAGRISVNRSRWRRRINIHFPCYVVYWLTFHRVSKDQLVSVWFIKLLGCLAYAVACLFSRGRLQRSHFRDLIVISRVAWRMSHNRVLFLLHRERHTENLHKKFRGSSLRHVWLSISISFWGLMCENDN